MPETFIALSNMTDDELISGIEAKPKFVVSFDHSNVPYNQSQQYIEGKTHVFVQLIRDNPDICFILDNFSFSVADCPNVVWCPMCWMMYPAMIDSHEIPQDWHSKRQFTVNHAGGRNRVNRILLEHWLAKNYPINQLLYSKSEESHISSIENIIRSSSFADKKHFRPNRSLECKWIKGKDNTRFYPSENIAFISHHSITTDFSDSAYINRKFFDAIYVLIPQMKLKSYLALQTEPQDPTLNTPLLQEKTWKSMMGGNLVLQFGNYKALELYKKLGLETFENCLDHSHLQSTDRYYQTIGGCENNQHLIADHQLIETMWFENLPAIKHNFELARDINHWFHLLEMPMRTLSEALSLSTNIEIPFVCRVPVDRFRYEFKL